MVQRESDTEVQVENQSESPVTDAQAETEGVRVSVGMKVGYMYSFLMQHTHRSFKGILACASVWRHWQHLHCPLTETEIQHAR